MGAAQVAPCIDAAQALARVLVPALAHGLPRCYAAQRDRVWYLPSELERMVPPSIEMTPRRETSPVTRLLSPISPSPSSAPGDWASRWPKPCVLRALHWRASPVARPPVSRGRTDCWVVRDRPMSRVSYPRSHPLLMSTFCASPTPPSPTQRRSWRQHCPNADLESP